MPIEFPVIINKKGTVLPESGCYFVVGGNGLFVRQTGPFFDRMVPVEKVGFLEPVNTSVNSRLKPVPPLIMGRAQMFFRRVFHKMHAESVLLLFCNMDSGEFDLECPQQEVEYTGIDYDPKTTSTHAKRPGWLRVGSIHSHCDFDASHSGTDRNDEIKFPGLHITMGHVTQDKFSCVSSYAFVKERFPVEPMEVISGLRGLRPLEVGRGFRHQGMYELQVNDQEVEALLECADQVEEEWLPRVKLGRTKHCGSGYAFGFRSTRGRPLFPQSLAKMWEDRVRERDQLPLADLAETNVAVEEPVQKTLFDDVPPTVEAVPVVEQTPWRIELPLVQAEPVHYPLALPMPSLEEILGKSHVENVVAEGSNGPEKPQG